MSQGPLNFDLIPTLAPQHQQSPMRRVVSLAAWGLAAGLIFRRFGHIRWVRVVYALPLGVLLGVAPMFVAFLLFDGIDTLIFGTDQSWASQICTVTAAGLTWIYFGSKGTRWAYRKMSQGI